MTDITTINIRGMSELIRSLGQYGEKIKVQGANRAASAAAKEFEKEAKKLCPVKTGNLKKSIFSGKRTDRGRSRNVEYIVSHYRGGRGKPDGWYAHIVEYGSFKKPGGYEIKSKRRTWYGRKLGMGAGGKFGTRIWHPPIKAQPYMRPAFDTKWESALNKGANAVAKYIESIGQRQIARRWW